MVCYFSRDIIIIIITVYVTLILLEIVVLATFTIEWCGGVVYSLSSASILYVCIHIILLSSRRTGCSIYES